jgi:hypothetical protein
MNAVADNLEETIRLEFDQARLDLAQAVRAERGSPDPAAEARVLACRAELDAVLDMWNATGHVG